MPKKPVKTETSGVIWEFFAIGSLFEKIRTTFAQQLAISGPQWLILTALLTLDDGDGVPVKAVAEQLRVKSSFVTTQTKDLEDKGLVSRKKSTKDGRVVLLSLTERVDDQLVELAEHRARLIDYVFSDLDRTDLRKLLTSLEFVRKRLDKAYDRNLISDI